MRFIRAFVLLACLIATVTVEGSPSASAATRVTLERPRLSADTVTFQGRAEARAVVRIVRRTSGGWVRIATDRADRHGRYHTTVERPANATWTVRAKAEGDRSRRRRVAPVVTAPPLEHPPVEDRPADEPPVEEQPVDETPAEEPPADDACGARVRKADGTWWDCSFVDEFDGSELDGTRWLAQETSFSGMTNGSACIRKEPWTIAVADGTLRLSAQRVAEPFTCRNPYGDFTTDRVSASVGTRDRFSQAYGRFAFRAKMPETRTAGAHSALWLYPSRHTYGQWPLSGEIDVAEWFSGVPGQVFPSVHYLGLERNTHTGLDAMVPDVSEFHTYVLEWTPTSLRFLYDDHLVYEHSWNPAAPLSGSQPFDKPFDIVLSQGWGQLWNAPTADTPDRLTMTVDWVRAWK